MSGMSTRRSRCQLMTASFERAVPRRDREGRVGRQLHAAQPLGDAHVVGVDHPVHAFAHRAQVVDLRVDERTRVERCVGAKRVAHPGDVELRVRHHDVVHLDERLYRELPVHGETGRVPLLGAQRLHFPRVEDGGGRLHALADGRRVVVEVDPRAPAPRLASHRNEVDVARLHVVPGERLAPGNTGVRAVEPVAPTVEGAGEAIGARASALDEPYTAMAAGVLEHAHLNIGPRVRRCAAR